jgi:hypothetical protein
LAYDNRPMTQWHPIFAQLLRPAVEAYYELETTVPVGDAPREADFLLLRRMSKALPAFRGLWRHLTTWNVLEFKGPTVTPPRGHLESLVEVGLGIDRQLRTQRATGQRLLPAEEVSFWYVANHLGRRFLREANRLLRDVEPLGAGLWRSSVLGRLIFLVSSIDLPVEADSLPLHIVGIEPLDTERAVAELVATRPELQKLYGGWVAALHAHAWKEIETMARRAGKDLNIDLEAAVNAMGIDRVAATVGLKRMMEHFGTKRVIDEIGLDKILANLSAADRRELKRRLQDR